MKRLRLGSLFSGSHCRKLLSGFVLLWLVLALCIPPVSAFNIDTGNPEFRIDWDNTVTYNIITRLKDQDEDLIGPGHENTDDGDRNFDKGLVMNRFDLLSELDIIYKTYGVRFSGAAWYDFVYNTSNDNDSPGTVNHDSVPFDEFTDETKDVHGSNVELLDAFTFGSFYLGNSMVSYRGGQFAQWWGESFFFGDNGVAGAMAPVDVSKAATLPNTQGKELIRPIPQISATWQLENNIELGAYYQFKFEPARMMATGSYFSFVDLISDGTELLVGPGFRKIDDQEARDDGQWGAKVKYTTPNGIDLGLYAMNYHFKNPNFIVVNPVEGTFYKLYPEDIEAYGASANTSFGIWTIATEVVYKRNMPLASKDITVFPEYVPGMPHEPQYAVGETLHANVNLFMPGLPSNFFSDSADFIFEVGGNTRLKVTDNEDLLSEDVKRTAWQMKAVYTPKWYQVLPGLELTLPMGFTYVPEGRTSAPSSLFPFHEAGDFNVGVGGTYNNVWNFELSYRGFFGSAGTDHNPWKDRDYVSFYIRRAF